MSLYTVVENEPVGFHGGREEHFLLDCRHAADRDEYLNYIAYIGEHCYTVERFPQGTIDMTETRPYQALLPEFPGDGFIIDKANKRMIVSIVRGGIVLESAIYDEEPQDTEFNRLASVYELNWDGGHAAILETAGDYNNDLSKASTFVDRDEQLKQINTYRKHKLVALAALVVMLGMAGSTALDLWKTHQLKNETELVKQKTVQLEVQKKSLEAKLKRKGLSAEEEYRTDAACQALSKLYPAPIHGFNGSSVKLQVGHPEMAKSIEGAKIVEPHAVEVELKDLSFLNEKATAAPTARPNR